MVELVAQVSKLELAGRDMDLTRALWQATTSTGPLLRGAWEIGQWLGREKLNQHELLDCLEMAKGLVVANQNGQQFFNEIIRSLDVLPVGPLFLQQSGSLGRLMAGDPNLSWIVSTVSCLFQHHRDDKRVVDSLTALIMESRRADRETNEYSALGGLGYRSEQTRVRAVLRKIVSSVWYNVVNVGCDTIPLPPEILRLCPRGHYLDPGNFGTLANTINTYCPTKAVLRMTHVLRDVLLWLLLHYDGTIVVNVSGQIVYRTDLGNPRRELEVRVASACSEGGCGGTLGKESFEILRHVSSKFEEFLSGYSFYGFGDLPPRPGIRQKLYDIPRPYPSDSTLWDKRLQVMVKSSAQGIMRWLLGVPLLAQQYFTSLGFSAEPGQTARTDQMTISLALKRVPAMINLQWGDSPASQLVDYGPAVVYDPSWGGEDRTHILVRCFPILADLARKASADCTCYDCHRLEYKWYRLEHQPIHNSISEYALRPGCLARVAVDEVLLLLAHGIADGFGVDDVSSVAETSPIVQGMAVILLKLALDQQVSWDVWFATASCVYLGCPFKEPVSEAHPAFGGTSFAAIQFGNLAAQAPWLDLTQELSVQGCFGLIGSRGRLGVVTRGEHSRAQFRSVEETFAIIETEGTGDTTHFCSSNKKPTSRIDHHFHVEEDASSVESDVILCQMDDRFYRLLLRIKTESHWRVVDPSDALSATIRLLPSVTCEHGAQPPETTPVAAKIYSMDQLLGRWPELVVSHGSPTANEDGTQHDNTFYLTHILDTQLKKNVALALSVCPTSVPSYPESSCLTCSLNHARDLERIPLRKGESGDLSNRYIINVKTQLADQGHGERRRLGA